MRRARFTRYPCQSPDDGGAGGGGGSAPAPAPAPPEPTTFSREYVTELRAENRAWRIKHGEAVAGETTAKDAAAAAVTAADARIAEHTTATDQRLIRSELKAVAVKAGIVDLDGLSFVDVKDVKLNADGQVEGADALIEALKLAKPYLFGTPSSSSTSKPPEKTPPTDKKAGAMTPEEYLQARRDAVRR